jgi:5-methylcytosine-specific restriction protein A
MPFAAKKPCRGCGRPAVESYCDQCQAKGKGREQRPSAARRLYGERWRRRARAWLKEPGHQFCVGYLKGVHGDRLVAAELPDHIKANKGDLMLFWGEDNWQPMCRRCNSRKAVAEEGAGYRRA